MFSWNLLKVDVFHSNFDKLWVDRAKLILTTIRTVFVLIYWTTLWSFRWNLQLGTTRRNHMDCLSLDYTTDWYENVDYTRNIKFSVCLRCITLAASPLRKRLYVIVNNFKSFNAHQDSSRMINSVCSFNAWSNIKRTLKCFSCFIFAYLLYC